MYAIALPLVVNDVAAKATVVQVIPSGECITELVPSPTATNRVPFQQIPLPDTVKVAAVVGVPVQVIPSFDHATAFPPPPTATNLAPDQATPFPAVANTVTPSPDQVTPLSSENVIVLAAPCPTATVLPMFSDDDVFVVIISSTEYPVESIISTLLPLHTPANQFLVESVSDPVVPEVG